MRARYVLAVLFLALALPLSMEAQSMKSHRRGYCGNVSLGGMIGINEKFCERASILTTHGYSFGDGTFIGLGTGFIGDLVGNGAVPLFAKWSYTFLDRTVSPYIGSSLGISIDDNISSSLYITPEIGVTVGRFFFNIQYSYYKYLLDERDTTYSTTKFHALSFGVGVSF